MTRCIRCGAEIEFDEASYAYLTLDGGMTCPSSLPGEAAVHRVEQRVSTKPKQPLGRRLLWGLLEGVVAYKAGEFVGGAITGGQAAPKIEAMRQEMLQNARYNEHDPWGRW